MPQHPPEADCPSALPRHLLITDATEWLVIMLHSIATNSDWCNYYSGGQGIDKRGCPDIIMSEGSLIEINQRIMW